MDKKKILILDDHRVVIEGIKTVLHDQQEFEVVGEATNAAQAMAQVKSLRPDIVITDISMPDLNGIEVTRQIKKLDANIRIIIFTMYSDKEYVIDLLRAGVNSYVLKEEPLSELMLAIRAATHGGVYFCHKVYAILQTYMEELAEGRKDKDLIERLSLREREIFVLLAEGKSIGNISDKLNISPKTVESHKYNIMEKLNIGSVIELTKIAIRKNLIQI